MVTSLISLTLLTSRFVIFSLQNCDMKYTTPAAIECGVFSGIMFIFSIFIEINWHTFVSSLFMFNLLQNRSINASGLVIPKLVLSEFIMSFSILFMMANAFLHPFVELVTSR